MRFLDLVDSRLDEPRVQRLLADAFGSSESALSAAERYESGEWTAFCCEENGEVVGLVGLEAVTPSVAHVRGIAVDARLRGKGIGQRLIQEVKARNPGVTLYVETDRDAVQFYRRCGFDVTTLGEKYPGVERFECTLRG